MQKVHLTREQRHTISAMHRQGCTTKMIALAIEKDRSAVSRELKRNADPKGKYSFEYAHDMTQIRKERIKKQRKLTPQLKKTVISMIEQDYSPQQISCIHRLKLPPAMRVNNTIFGACHTVKITEKGLMNIWTKVIPDQKPVKRSESV